MTSPALLDRSGDISRCAHEPFVIVDSNGPIPGLVGMYRRGSMPKYFKGPRRPRLGDLAYTEYALLGV